MFGFVDEGRAAAGLEHRVATLLYGNLGASPPLRAVTRTQTQRLANTPAWLVGLWNAALYAALFCVLPRLINPQSDRHLFWLAVFGSVYSAIAVTAARQTTAVINRQVSLIVPRLSSATEEEIDVFIASRFRVSRLTLTAGAVSLSGTLVSAWVLHIHDLPHTNIGEIAWACLGLFGLFFQAARATDTARFYRAFSRFLPNGREALFPFAPATSALIRDVAQLGRIMLLFWMVIFSSITLLIPTLAFAESNSALPAARDLIAVTRFGFVRLVLPITLFFSGVLGTVVFLQSESAIRTTVDNALRRTVEQLEECIGALVGVGLEAEMDRDRQIDRLVSLRTELLKSGRYTNFVVSGVSLILPFIGSLVPFIKLLTGE